jgi:putative transposase
MHPQSLAQSGIYLQIWANGEFLIHDRDNIFSARLDQQVRNFGLKVLKTPVRSPQATALCERLLGTLRRECLDYWIPLSEHHLHRLLQAWVPHYNAGRPHMSLGPGIPQPPSHLPVALHVHRPAPASAAPKGRGATDSWRLTS